MNKKATIRTEVYAIEGSFVKFRHSVAHTRTVDVIPAGAAWPGITIRMSGSQGGHVDLTFSIDQLERWIADRKAQA